MNQEVRDDSSSTTSSMVGEVGSTVDSGGESNTLSDDELLADVNELESLLESASPELFTPARKKSKRGKIQMHVLCFFL